jgi:flagellar hook-associated protein FlgK
MGTSKVMVANPAFTSFSADFGGVSLSVQNLSAYPTSLESFASDLQAQLRAADQSNSISVKLASNGADLVISDAMGRKLSNVVLTSADGLSPAGTPSISNKVANVQELADRINSQFKTVIVDSTATPPITKNVNIGVKASIGMYGDLLLSTLDPNGTDSISIGPSKKADGSYEPNALGLEPIDYTADERLKLQLADDPSKSSIRFSFGTYGVPPVTGSPFDLAKAGLRTGAYVEGGSVDDLLVFVTGQGKASVAASYAGQPLNVRDNLRTQSLVVKFTASDRYTITDASTGTELADRHYDPNVLEPLIDFQGLQIKLSHAPAMGDSFQVDGNHDGLGNNANMLQMVDLAKKPVIDGKTLANTYIDQINNVGNLAQQATITQQALTVVHDQAVAKRDKVSGVNLDEEAAALIRYQQAYQASAKALQISGQLFDSIVQIR